MATIEDNVIAFVLSDTSIKATLGDRLHLDPVPQNIAFPRGRLMLTGARRDGRLEDAAGSAPNRYSFTLELQADKQEDASSLRTLAIAKLNCARGTFADSSTFLAIFAEDWSFTHTANTPGDDTGIFSATCSMEVVL